jgi:hypothetical protein
VSLALQTGKSVKEVDSGVGGWTGPGLGQTSPLLVEPVTVLCYQLRYYVTNKKMMKLHIGSVCTRERERDEVKNL